MFLILLMPCSLAQEQFTGRVMGESFFELSPEGYKVLTDSRIW